jgi:large subunit ribosomal protein L32e
MIKKKHPKFNVPNFGAKSRKRVPERWRKQRGIDNKKRIKRNFMGAEPTIGYRNPESIRGIRASGRRMLIVRNVNEMRMLVLKSDKDKFDVAIAHSVSKRKRAEIASIASSNGIRVTNSGIK